MTSLWRHKSARPRKFGCRPYWKYLWKLAKINLSLKNRRWDFRRIFGWLCREMMILIYIARLEHKLVKYLWHGQNKYHGISSPLSHYNLWRTPSQTSGVSWGCIACACTPGGHKGAPKSDQKGRQKRKKKRRGKRGRGKEEKGRGKGKEKEERKEKETKKRKGEIKWKERERKILKRWQMERDLKERNCKRKFKSAKMAKMGI